MRNIDNSSIVQIKQALDSNHGKPDNFLALVFSHNKQCEQFIQAATSHAVERSIH